MVCLLSLGCTIVRETFNDWIPVYLRDFFGYSMGDAASASAVFPAARRGVGDRDGLAQRPTRRQQPRGRHGGRSDRHSRRLGVLGLLRSSTVSPLLPLVAIGTTALCLLGPYSYLGGALACDFGGKQGTAQSSGIIDGVGYLGSVIGGVTVARASIAVGWGGVFMALAVISLIAAIGAGYLHRLGAAPGASEP